MKYFAGDDALLDIFEHPNTAAPPASASSSSDARTTVGSAFLHLHLQPNGPHDRKAQPAAAHMIQADHVGAVLESAPQEDHARFEIVHEVLVSRVSDVPRYLLHQIRVFGDSPIRLSHDVIGSLVDTIPELFGRPLARDGSIDDPLTLLRVFYGGTAGQRALPR